MGVFLTNTTTLSYAVELTPGVLPGSPIWFQLEPDSIGTLGATITTVPRNPISKKRMDRKGSVTDLDSAVDFTSDLTLSSFNNFIEGFLYASAKTQVTTEPTTVAVDSYEHPALSSGLTAGTLVYGRDFADSDNDGLKVVDALSTTTSTKIVETLVVETVTANTGANIDVVGFQGAADDLVIDANLNLASTVYNFVTSDVDFNVGQRIYIGGGTAATDFPVTVGGYAVITKVEANLLTLTDTPVGFQADPSGGGETVQIFTGNYVRNVPVCDADYLSRTYQFEAVYSDAECANEAFEYAEGNSANSLTLNMPLTDKVTVDWGFIGTDTDSTQVAAKGPTPLSPFDTTAFNTTSDLAQISLTKSSDGTPLAAFFKSLTLTIDNGVSPVKVLGTLGGVGANLSNFVVTGSAQVLFDDLAAINAVKGNETVSLSWKLRDGDGTIYFNIPSMTLGNAGKSFDRDEEIKLDIDGNAFEDDFFGHVMSVTIFPFTPA